METSSTESGHVDLKEVYTDGTKIEATYTSAFFENASMNSKPAQIIKYKKEAVSNLLLR